jgi:hypothetical protein
VFFPSRTSGADVRRIIKEIDAKEKKADSTRADFNAFAKKIGATISAWPYEIVPTEMRVNG